MILDIPYTKKYVHGVFLCNKIVRKGCIVSAKYSCGFSNLLDSSIIVNEI
jgi:hypothetical protein